MTDPDSALELAASLARREVSPTEVLDSFLERVDRLDPQLNAFSLRDDERARADARVAQDLIASSDRDELPPFCGVPIPIKDLVSVAGWPTSWGSTAVPDVPAPQDDLVVERFRRAGFVLMGKTTTPEFGTVSFTESDRHGITRNPWNLDHTPGGSSGGAGAAVASRMAPVAHASDGGGSIRIPASCNGLVGLKPSRNRITERSERLTAAATSGVLTRSVAETAALLDVMSTFDPNVWNSAPPPTRPFSSEVGRDPGVLRIRVNGTSPLGVEPDRDCLDALDATAAILSDLGHSVSTDAPSWPDTGTLLTGFLQVWSTISACVDGLDLDRLEPHNRANRDLAEATNAIEFSEAVMSLQLASRAICVQFGADFDVLVTPTMAVTPPQVGTIWDGMDTDPGAPLVNATPMAAYTAVFNITGQPAISLPLHTSAAGLPVGVQFVAAPWSEALLLRLASQVEEAAPWADRRPALVA